MSISLIRFGLVGAAGALAVASAHAGIAFSTFGPSDAYNDVDGTAIYGSTFADGGKFNQFEADQFTSALSGRVSTIRLAATHFTGDNSIVVTLYTDGVDDFGSALGQWTVTNLPAFGTSNAVTSFSVPDNITLEAGQKYWLGLNVVDPGSDSHMDWQNAASSFTGNEILVVHDHHFLLSDEVQQAFEVQVSPVPEPATLSVLAGGILFGIRKRRKLRV